jgi:hypothetical protein
VAQFGVDSSLTADEADSQIASPAKGFAEREPYRDAIRALKPGEVLRITPSTERNADGKLVESLRAIQFRIIGAAKDTKIDVKYGKANDDSGDVLVWLDSNPTPKRPRRNKKDGGEQTAESANGAADAALDARQPVTV